MKRYRSGSSRSLTVGFIAAVALLTLLGCARAPEPVRIDAGTAEQLFTPRLALQEDGKLYAQWVEFHKDSIGAAGCFWDEGARSYSTPELFDFMNRRWVQCIPELQRFYFADRRSATMVAHSCIQESYMLFRDSTGKREAAWLTAPAVLTYPIVVDSHFVVFFESPLSHGLITVWLDRGGREVSRDTFAIRSPDFAAADGNGVTFARADDTVFHVYHMGRLCGWVDSATVTRTYPAKQQIGTDYFVSGGSLFIITGYKKPDAHGIEFETHVLRGTKRESQHLASAKRESLGEYVAFRGLPSGGEFPYLFALASAPDHMHFAVLELDDGGYWSRVTPAAVVGNTVQEFSALRIEREIFATYTAATSDTLAAANACYSLRFNLE